MPASPQTGARIRRARKLLHLTQQQLAEKVGVSRNTVDSWENGRSYPKRYDVALEEVLGIRLSGEDAPETEWERWERSVLENPDIPPELARAIVTDARRAAGAPGPGGPGSSSAPSPASSEGRTAGRHRAGG